MCRFCYETIGILIQSFLEFFPVSSSLITSDFLIGNYGSVFLSNGLIAILFLLRRGYKFPALDQLKPFFSTFLFGLLSLGLVIQLKRFWGPAYMIVTILLFLSLLKKSEKPVEFSPSLGLLTGFLTMTSLLKTSRLGSIFLCFSFFFSLEQSFLTALFLSAVFNIAIGTALTLNQLASLTFSPVELANIFGIFISYYTLEIVTKNLRLFLFFSVFYRIFIYLLV